RRVAVLQGLALGPYAGQIFGAEVLVVRQERERRGHEQGEQDAIEPGHRECWQSTDPPAQPQKIGRLARLVAAHLASDSSARISAPGGDDLQTLAVAERELADHRGRAELERGRGLEIEIRSLAALATPRARNPQPQARVLVHIGVELTKVLLAK